MRIRDNATPKGRTVPDPPRTTALELDTAMRYPEGGRWNNDVLFTHRRPKGERP